MRGRWPAVVAVLVVAIAVVWLMGRSRPVAPFDVTSTAPDGYGAVAELLADRGVDVDQRRVSDVLGAEPGPGDGVVVARPDRLVDDELDALRDAAERGAVVVVAEVEPPLPPVSGRSLAEVPASPVDPGDCAISALSALGPVDAAFAELGLAAGERSCYRLDDGLGVLFDEESVGSGRIVTMAGPFLWANARLQPDKERGGRALDNGATAVALLGGRSTVYFVTPVASPGAVVDELTDPLSLVPFPVQLAMVQLAIALVVAVWWRGRRLGPLPEETLPVELSGAELVGAVGDLMRRRGSTARTATVLRASTRAQLADALGLGPNPAPDQLIASLARHVDQPPEVLLATLFDQPGSAVSSPSDLVRLARSLDAVRQEVMHVSTR